MFADMKEEVLEYLNSVPLHSYIESMTEEDRLKHLFDAYEDIHSLHPKIPITPRMVVKQFLFRQEQVQNGYDVYNRHGIKSQSINDASITFKDGDSNYFDPYVWAIISGYDNTTKGMYGHLV